VLEAPLRVAANAIDPVAKVVANLSRQAVGKRKHSYTSLLRIKTLVDQSKSNLDLMLLGTKRISVRLDF
jgi:hypothetical protein